MDEIHIALPTRPRDPERHLRWKKGDRPRYQSEQPLLNTVSSSSSSSSSKGASGHVSKTSIWALKVPRVQFPQMAMQKTADVADVDKALKVPRVLQMMAQTTVQRLARTTVRQISWTTHLQGRVLSPCNGLESLG